MSKNTIKKDVWDSFNKWIIDLLSNGKVYYKFKIFIKIDCLYTIFCIYWLARYCRKKK